jgi:EmrB/QacA subfamily drug resistance transporter
MVKAVATDVVAKRVQAPETDPQRWLMLSVVLLATFMGTLDTFIVNVAIPSIESGLHARFAQIQLVIAGYTLAFAVVLVTGGRLGDLYGRRRLFLLGVAGFTLASLCCGLAPTVMWLIVFRVLQGGMAALMLPQVVSLLNVSFPPAERGSVFSRYVTTIGLASIMGQLIGGLLLAANVLGLGWRSVFLVNLPLGVLTIVAAWLLVPESRRPTTRRLDLGGVMLLSVSLFLLLSPLAERSGADWSVWSTLGLGMAGLMLASFLAHEGRLTRQGGAPLVPLALFQSRAFVAGVLSIFLVNFLFAAILLTLAFYLQAGLHYVPWQSGLVVMVMGVAFMLSSSVSARVVRALKSRALQLGAALVTLGYLVALLTVQYVVPHYGLGPLLVGLYVISSGNGTLSAPVMNLALSGIDSAMAGAASGVYATVQQTATALGVALLGTLFAALLATHASQAQAFVSVLLVSALISLALLLTVRLFPNAGWSSAGVNQG